MPINTNKLIENTLYTINRVSLDYPCNILYEKHNSFFDRAMDLTHELFNTIDTESTHLIDHIPYSAVWINQHIQSLITKYNIPGTHRIVAIHDSINKLVKKEDIDLMRNSLMLFDPIVFDQDPTYNISHMHRINYGVPIPTEEHLFPHKDKDIVVINTRRNPMGYSLRVHLKNHYPNIDIIEDISLSIDKLYTILSQYKLCVDLDDYYSLLLAGAVGCHGITAVASYDDSIHKVTDLSQLINKIQSLLAVTEQQEAKMISDKILAKYDFNHFLHSIKTYITKLYMEPTKLL